MTAISAAAVPASATRPGGRGRARRIRSYLGVLPFAAYTTLFLLIPTVIVAIGAFQSDRGGFSLENFRAMASADVLSSLVRSLVLSAVSAVVAAVVGAVVAYLLSTAAATSVVRKVVVAASSVLAQFAGVMLAFAFTFTFIAPGLIGRWLQSSFGYTLDPNYFTTLSGLIVVYIYFQVPLMIIVFLPAVDGIRPQWREATESLGGSTWVFWRRVAGPLLGPSFLGALLLLFTNAFSAYATAAALVGLTTPIIPLEIRAALISETGLGAPNLAKAEALLMVVVVAVVMTGYYLIQRRAAKWLG